MPGLLAGARRDGRDVALIDRLGDLYVGVVADCLDQLGLRDQVMAPHVRPLFPTSVAGYAATFALAATEEIPDELDRRYAGELEAVDAVQPGDVVIASTLDRSFWGELLATAARRLGGRGVVADAFTRDTSRLIDMGFSTFVAGISASDALGRVDVIAHGVAIKCAGVRVEAGDLVLADNDGVVVVPSGAATEVISKAEAKVKDENRVRSALLDGMSASEAFRTYGVL